MNKQFYQSQYILNKVFNNTNSILKASLNTSQDYLNAVYDTTQDSLRVNIAGSMLPAVYNVNDLPITASEGQICPVINVSNNSIDFYEWSNNQWKHRGSALTGQSLTNDEKLAITWMTEHLDNIKELADFNYIVNVQEITLSKDSTIINVQGQQQNIDDDLNGDNDDTTPYRIDVTGYVLSIATYADNNAIVPDKYYTRITYDSANGGLGTSHVYLQQDEYDYFANLNEGKNIIKVYYVTNSTTSPIKKMRYILNNDKTVTDTSNNNIINVQDVQDTDGDNETVCCINSPGYVLGIQTYASSEAIILDKYYTKMTYQSDGIHAGSSKIYMDQEEYQFFSNLQNDKNVMDIYYVATIFPASITISETQFQFPNEQEVRYVVIDASGNIHNIEDILDKDGDETTHIKLSVNGYVLDMDGYYDEGQPIKKRLIVKMSYNSQLDITDIYLDKEYYDYVSALGNGKNIVSIYTLGAGIGIDASRIQLIDSELDGNSQKAIQNKAVKEAIDSLTNEINTLKNRVNELQQ